eukprot:2005640-Amphidinium_carterae.1
MRVVGSQLQDRQTRCTTSWWWRSNIPLSNYSDLISRVRDSNVNFHQAATSCNHSTAKWQSISASVFTCKFSTQCDSNHHSLRSIQPLEFLDEGKVSSSVLTCASLCSVMSLATYLECAKSLADADVEPALQLM